jgi:hypothetical protein
LKDLVLSQAKIIENLKEKLKNNDKMLELMNSKIEGLTASIKNQLSFNKRVETQLAQFATAIPVVNLGEILGQPETSLEYVKMVSMRFDKPLCQEATIISQNHHSSPRKKILVARQSHAHWATCLQQRLL